MAKYIKKQMPAELIEVKAGEKLPGCVEDAGNHLRVWNAPQECYISLQYGDFVNVTDLKDIYPIAKEYVEKYYIKL